ncbi:alpha,alpha-trehalase nth1 [Conoideocrella luteorostrata]|uniref:Trehalase n=1 Tax=Conoideocrella luteorostrata TaxID=1105319 RepID=A0AAJ0CLJ0_9HYPO|nr:alpha,alpha-trehalase nth1 [Conoideocrella luteorostrata]
MDQLKVNSAPSIFVDAKTYYRHERHKSRVGSQTRTYSQHQVSGGWIQETSFTPFRRGSHDENFGKDRQFLIEVEPTLNNLRHQEDTDNDMKITIEDNGPKVIHLRTATSAGHNRQDIRGTYMLSNLLQELTFAKEYGRKQIVLDEARLTENPVDRLARLIRDHFWDSLTRRLDASSVGKAAPDPKDWTCDRQPRIYVPAGEPAQYEYFKRVAQDQPDLRLDVQLLPKRITPDFVRDINNKPGLLALDMEPTTNANDVGFQGVPFVVPGGRFNELYGWDSYFIALGLLVNDRTDLAKSTVTNFCFCIKHYGMVLNATRSYYLGRSHPPFLTDLALRVYENIKHELGAKEFLEQAILAAINEYYNVWTAEPRFDRKTGLSRYHSKGIGITPETEPSHFAHILQPYMVKYRMTYDEFFRAYNYGQIQEPDLDEYFIHDRALRESGHDSSYRVEGICADLALVDLNCLLYKYEVDIARTILQVFNNNLVMTEDFSTGTPFRSGEVISSAVWDRKAKRWRLTMFKLMWDEDEGMFFDYNTKTQNRTKFESCTTLWPLWAGVATPHQASVIVNKGLPRFEAVGGLLSTTEKSRGCIGPDRPNRQWDYPSGWAPHQIIAWTGLLRYHFTDDAQRIAYKWLFMMTKAFADYNGVVVEKYDVTRPVDPHRVDAEYGNQGLDFQGANKEGFGWANSSYVYGLQIIDAQMRRALGALTPWETFVRATAHSPKNAEDSAESTV